MPTPLRATLARAPQCLLLICPLVALLSTSSFAFACSGSIQQGNVGTHAWIGGQQAFATVEPQNTYANIEFWNPYPVWTASSTWVADENNTVSQHYIAQVGWTHEGPYAPGGGDANGRIFVQYMYNDGSMSGVFHYNYPSNGETEDFAIQWHGVVSGQPGYSFCWNEECQSASTSNNPNWTPKEIDVQGEILDYTSPNNGSMSPGAQSQPIHVSQVGYTGNAGNYNNAALSSVPLSVEAAFQRSNFSNGYTFTIWDSRCYSR